MASHPLHESGSGNSRTTGDVRLESAKWAKAGIDQSLFTNRGFMRHALISEPAAVVRRQKIELRTQRHDAGRVHVALAAVIVPLDVVHVDGRGDASLLIEIAQIVREIGIINDAAQVAFEVAVVDGVEAAEGAIEHADALGRFVVDDGAALLVP